MCVCVCVCVCVRPQRINKPLTEQDFDLVVIGHIESRLAVIVLHSEMLHRPVRGDELTDDVRLPVACGIDQSGASTVWFL